jgi:hypothetical protein
MKKPQDSTKAIFPPVLGLAAAILAVSTSSVFIRFAQQENAPSLAIVVGQPCACASGMDQGERRDSNAAG